MPTKWKPVSNLEAGKPLPDEEVDFILIGAGLIPLRTLQSWQPDSLQVYLVLAQCQHTRLWRWFCRGNVTIWPGVIRHFRFISLKYVSRVGTDETSRNISFWPKAAAGDVSEVEWRQFIKAERLSAGVDYPISLFWKDLVKIYTNAKVGNSVIRLVCSGRWVSSFRNCPLVVSLIIALNRSVLKSTI